MTSYVILYFVMILVRMRNVYRSIENDFECYTLFCDDFSEDSKFRSVEMISYVLPYFVMILVRFRNFRSVV